MNRRMLILSVLAFTLIAACGFMLSQINSRQRLASPGVTAHAIPGSIRLAVDLPAKVGDYSSEALDVDDITLGVLPKDTSFGARRYKGPAGSLDLRVVMMGRDRTSLHKPQICLTGMGWTINDEGSCQTVVHVTKPFNYDLPVVKLLTRAVDDQNQVRSGVYVYWYVADDAISASTLGFQRMWLMTKNLVTTGVLQRWAYVSCFAESVPGQENETFERLQRFIAQAVPEFQLYPRPNQTTVAAATP